ncbi:hypothetical protein FNF28_02575 [Cafeteria roenbergensis]|nr:hypothetical protein FNF28_02575 [Cafeteria roenbergensis]
MSPLRYPGSEQGAVAIKVPRVAATVPSRFETVVSVGARERDAFGSREPRPLDLPPGQPWGGLGGAK